MRPRLSKVLLTATALPALGALLTLGTLPGAAEPRGPSVVGGAATVTGTGTGNVTVNQSTNNAIINWHTFNIGAGESVRFNQPGSSSIALNRVTGGLGPSEIMGTLSANGRVFVINRDGVLFGPNAVVNTAGFLASTHDIRNEDFMAGRMNFNIPGRPDASIVNLGRITATSGGFAALVAPGVRNSGTITATLGTAALAASGNGFTLDMYGDRLITLSVGDQIAGKVIDVATGKPLSSLVTNDGRIRANGGRVELTAAAARAVVDSVINTSGVIQANSIGRRNGMIVLSAGTASSKPADAPTQVIRISGTVSAAGKRRGTSGGTVVVSGEDIRLTNARVDASGRNGGGRVMIGGDWGGGNPNLALVNNQSTRLEGYSIATASRVSVDAGSTINVSATERGNGGKAILWSDEATTFAGTILARGGLQTGDGGFVETSGHQHLAFTGNVDTRAPTGRAGTLLLDPADYYIQAVGGPTPPAGADVITNVALQNLLANGNVVIATNNASNPSGQNGDIFVNASVNWTGDTNLTLSAYRNISINFSSTISNTGGGNLILRANSTGNPGTTAGDVSFGPSGVNFSNSTGTVSIYHNPIAGYAFPNYPTDYASLVTTNPGVPNQVRAYALVNDAIEFTAIGASPTTLAGTYALGRSFTLSSFAGFAAGTTFTGTFDGNGGLGTNYTLSFLALSSASPTGLFPIIGSTGTVRNLNLDMVSITATAGLNTIGTIAGINSGVISNVTVSNGSVNGGTQTGVTAGGLVGLNNGTITGSSANVAVTVGNGGLSNDFNYAGGLAGINTGTISNSSASGGVSSGNNSFAGGLAGQNGNTGQGGAGLTALIQNSSASGPVTSTSTAGGLVGANLVNLMLAPGATATITSSNASGSVVLNGGTAAGGLVGQNEQTIQSSYATGPVTGTNGGQLGGLAGTNSGSISQSVAYGPVTGNGDAQLGGLVGNNTGSISSSAAGGSVTGTGNVIVGGLVGQNDGGLIVNSFASGPVTANGPGAADIIAGGLVGDNSGPIINSFATGPVTSNGGDAIVGGLAGTNFFGTTISGSFALGNVVVNGAVGGIGGGLVGANAGTINGFSFAAGNVSVNATVGIAGGLVGLNFGNIYQAYATGKVDVSGPVGIAGGFVGLNVGLPGETFGLINQSFSTGAVTSSADYSLLGGFAGVNVGTIFQAYATGAVTGTAGSIIGGLAAINLGSLNQTYAIGRLTGGSIVGGLVGADGNTLLAGINFNGDLVPGLSGVGTATNSYWDPATTGVTTSAGGTSRTTQQFLAGLPPGFDPAVWGNLPNPSYPHFTWQPASTIPTANSNDLTLNTNNIGSQQQIIDNLISTVQFAALNTSPVLNTQGGVRLPQFPPPQPPPGQQQQQQQQQPLQRIIDIPPLDVTQFRQDEVLMQIVSSRSIAEVEAAVRGLGLSLLESQSLGGTNTIMLRFHIDNGQPVRDVMQRMATIQLYAILQPNYIYHLTEEAVPASRGDTGPGGDAAQYILKKFSIADVHRIVRGTNVPIAVIDSEIDAAHPDLQGVIAQRFSAAGAPEKPHAHGTGMAGAIASHQRLMGIAPGARIYAVHAFSTKAATAESTTYNILKGLDWAASQGVRVINMSFAGPKDPSLERALKAAYDKGIVLIAAAGNAGPKSPPLYPGADPYVIAVTATDADDKIFSGANRGKYVSVSAPGVDILVPAPEGTYQLTTGTSVAAAEVSGVAALLLERNPRLTPADIRRILTTSAKRLAPGDRNDDFGSGLVDPLKALQSADPRTATSPTLRQR
jgi:filamentous hemagglutinin family protein